MSTGDKTMVLILCAMFVAWVLGSWVKALDTTVVALAGLCLMAMPKYGVASFDKILKDVPMGAWLMGQGIGGVALVCNTAGVVTWIMGNFSTIPSNTSVILFLIVVGVVLAVLHLPIPIGPSLLGLTIGPLLILAGQIGNGLNPMYVCLCLCFNCAFNMVLPLDSVPLLTYGEGYYTFGDYFKGGIPATLIMIVVVALWLPIILPIAGFV